MMYGVLVVKEFLYIAVNEEKQLVQDTVKLDLRSGSPLLFIVIESRSLAL